MRASSKRDDVLAAAFDQTMMPSPIAIAADHDSDAILPGKSNVAGILAQPDAECLQMALFERPECNGPARAFARRQLREPAPFVCTAIAIHCRRFDLGVGAFAVYSQVVTS